MPKQFFRGMLILLLALLCGYGIYAIVVKIGQKDNLGRYISQADTAFKQVVYYDTTQKFQRHTPRQFKPLHIELNGADTTSLKKVYGIGSVFAKRIVDYRTRLGGFINVDQLKEVKGLDDEKYKQIFANFYVDSSKIVKINVNFAPANGLTVHPYVTASMAKRIEKYLKSKDKKSKGGIFNLQELVNNDILLPKEAQKIAPYLTF